MKSLHPSRCALSVCAMVMLLASCGGPEQTIGLTAPAPSLPAATSHGQFGGEVFAGATFHLKCIVERYATRLVDFSATGTAKGPFPGTFTAGGYWIFDKFPNRFYRFHEHFTLMSGKHIYSGNLFNHVPARPAPKASCAMLNDVPHYSTPRGWHGRVTVRILEHRVYNEAFQ